MKRLIFVLLLLASPAYAQWQVPNHATPTGRGAGVTGFGSAGPGGTDQVLAGNGPASDPSFKPAIAMLNFACTLSPSTCNFFFGYYSPQWFGALCNGTGDDGPAIQSAINVSGAGAAAVKLCTGTHRVVTPLVWNKRRVSITGAGRYISIIDFEPNANATLFTVGAGLTVSSHAYEEAFRGFSIISSDTTHTLTGWNLIDVSQAHLSDLSCSQTVLGGGYWGGSGTGSICLQTNGRDLSTFENLEFFSRKPIVLAENPNVYLSTDHYVFRDIYLVGDSTGPCIQSAAVLTNLIFDGRQAWAVCKGGFKAVDAPVSNVSWNNVTFNNARAEQSPDATVPDIDISVTTTNLRGLWINSIQIGAAGIKLRGVLGATIGTWQASCVHAQVLDLNTTNSQILLFNNRSEAACTSSLGGMTPAAGSIASPTGSAIPAFVMYN